MLTIEYRVSEGNKNNFISKWTEDLKRNQKKIFSNTIMQRLKDSQNQVMFSQRQFLYSVCLVEELLGWIG